MGVSVKVEILTTQAPRLTPSIFGKPNEAVKVKNPALVRRNRVFVRLEGLEPPTF
jgi:hypothetical protein